MQNRKLTGVHKRKKLEIQQLEKKLEQLLAERLDLESRCAQMHSFVLLV
jgi:hypothetical protein